MRITINSMYQTVNTITTFFGKQEGPQLAYLLTLGPGVLLTGGRGVELPLSPLKIKDSPPSPINGELLGGRSRPWINLICFA